MRHCFYFFNDFFHFLHLTTQEHGRTCRCHTVQCAFRTNDEIADHLFFCHIQYLFGNAFFPYCRDFCRNAFIYCLCLRGVHAGVDGKKSRIRKSCCIAIDGISQSLFLTDFLEQTRAHAAAKNRIENSHGVFQGMFPFQPFKSNACMELFHIFFLLYPRLVVRSLCFQRTIRRLRLPSAKVMVQKFQHFFPFEVSCHGKHHIFCMIIFLVISADFFRIQIANGFFCSKNGHAQTAFPPDTVLQAVVNQFLRRVVIHINFFCNDVPFLIHFFLRKSRMQKHITHNFHGLFHMLVQHTGMITSIFFCGIGVDLSAQSVHFLCNLPCGTVFCSLEHHVFNVMGNAVFLGTLVSRSVFHPNAKGNTADVADFLQHHLYSVF